MFIVVSDRFDGQTRENDLAFWQRGSVQKVLRSPTEITAPSWLADRVGLRPDFFVSLCSPFCGTRGEARRRAFLLKDWAHESRAAIVLVGLKAANAFLVREVPMLRTYDDVLVLSLPDKWPLYNTVGKKRCCLYSSVFLEKVQS